jgi:bile acid:Na+ symporter, BASS family
MDSAVFSVFLPIALALVMFGLGLTLTAADFARVVKYPRATVISLACQIVVLPLICYGLVLAFGLTGALAVGVMILVASPGGTVANLFSHLSGGDVALNVTLTAINSVIAVFTIPVVVGLSVNAFMADSASLGIQTDKFVQVFAVVLVPVAIGMLVRHKSAGWALRMERTVKIASTIALALVILGAITTAFDHLMANIWTLGPVTLLLCAASLVIGYYVPRWFGVGRRQSISSAMEVGIHNATMAIAIAVTVLGNEVMAIPAAMYGVVMFIPAGIAMRLLAVKRPERVLVSSGS